MKPICLTMSAFGSYGKTAVIDFSCAEHGLFLITGDTGAGKTTIFDGISYALYGESSGKKRDGKMMRSQYASLSDETYVELIFSYRGEIYKVRRNPEYVREKKRGTGVAKTAASVELTLPDGSVFRGTGRDTDQRIREIIGVDKEQFSQIAMIAQGDFLKLLYAKSENRKKIFSTIFDTEIYRRVEDKLAEKVKELKARIESSGERVKTYVRGIRMPETEEGDCTDAETEEFKERIKKLSEEESPDIGEALELLEDLIRLEEEQSAEAKRLYSDAEEAHRKALEEYGKKEADNGLIERFEKATEELEALKAARSGYEERKLLCSQADRAFGVKVYEEKREQEAKRFKLACKEWEAAQAEYEEASEDFRTACGGNAEASEDGAGKKADKLSDFLAGLKAREAELKKAEEKKEEAAHKRRQIEKEEKALEGRRAELEKELEILTRTREQYGYFQERFFCEQAGILARERLRPGEPCPVCGSLSHPAPAKILGEAVTENQVKKARENWEKQRESCETLSQTVQERSTRLDEAKKQLRKEEKEIPEKLADEQESIKQSVLLTEKMIRADRHREESRWKRAQAETSLGRAQEDFETARREAGFADETSYLAIMSRWVSKREADAEKKQVEEYFLSLRGKKDAAEALKKGAEGKEYTDLSELRGRINILNEDKKRIQAAGERISMALHNHKSTRENLKGEQKEYGALLEQFLLYDGLSQTAGGKRKGRVRMDFETYVQRMYFERILAAANKRFLTFTDGRMKLKSRPMEDMDLTGPAGLEINVYVMATGKERDVKTLSGGEAFLASLSLALGFSDVVQSQAGAVRLESMFVDEGFGALDDRTRDQAIRVLNELAGDDRMIGIISHVEELKDSIERKLTVTRDSQGSTARWT